MQYYTTPNKWPPLCRKRGLKEMSWQLVPLKKKHQQIFLLLNLLFRKCLKFKENPSKFSHFNPKGKMRNSSTVSWYFSFSMIFYGKWPAFIHKVRRRGWCEGYATILIWFRSLLCFSDEKGVLRGRPFIALFTFISQLQFWTSWYVHDFLHFNLYSLHCKQSWMA